MARGGFNVSGNLMKQAQKMQRDMERKKKEFEQREFEATAGGGAVCVKANGKREILEVKINPEVVDPKDVEMLEDLVMVATNEVLRKIDETFNEDMFDTDMGKIISGLF